MNKIDIFEDKKKQFLVASQHQEPDRVPILSMINNFAISNAGRKTQECFDDLSLERECWGKALEDYYFDGIYSFGTNMPFKAYIQILESETYCISANEITVQHMPSTHMTEDEYDELISDPVKYLCNKVGYRKAKALHKPYPENYKALEEAFDYSDKHTANVGANRKYVMEDMGMPIITQGNMSHPMDMFFDYVRGFRETLGDLRRRPQMVKDALKALEPFYSGSLPKPNTREAYPFIFNTCHIPTFLNKKQFEEFYFPYYSRMANAAYEAGTKMMSFCEGNWTQHYDCLNSLPSGVLVDLMESDNIYNAKKLIGANVTIAGGMPLALLKGNTIEECKDYAKKLVDEIAPGGGYFFSVDKTLIGPADCKPENLKEVNAFVHEYGKYK